jgi:hypothetical protein
MNTPSQAGFSLPFVATLVAAWCLCVAAGLWALLAYELTPATTAAAPGRWPTASRLVRDDARPSLVVFVHPHCPCSRASLAELNALVSDCKGRLALQIVFIKPAGCEEGWEQTDLLATAQRIPGAVVSVDLAGTEAARFGATTSGESLLYAPNGRLLFHGGLTRSRGHQGDNPGRAAVTALIRTGNATQQRSAVYGCGLSSRRAREKAEAR